MIIRQSNLLGQQRLDLAHLRAIEASAAGDFDVLAGQVMTGQTPLIIKGFQILNSSSSVGLPASSLQVIVAGSYILHPTASENGTIFNVPSDRSPETLASTNSVVTGNFTSSAINYVGMDLLRSQDESTSDLVQFLDANTNLETPKTVPLARTLNYRFIISTTPFAASSNMLPICLVTTDANNNVSYIQDARPMMFRLGTGGDAPNALNSYVWPEGRSASLDVFTAAGSFTGTDTFSGVDRAIASLKEWADAVMTRLWEIGGGERWYTPNADRNVKLLRDTGSLLPNGENFSWDAGTNTLTWAGLTMVFDNSTGWKNTIADGSTVLADGQCLYIDLDRTQNATGLTPQVDNISTLGTPLVPGARYVLAWRNGSTIIARDQAWPVNFSFPHATTTSYGVVKLTEDGDNAIVPGMSAANKKAVAAGLSRDSSTYLGSGALVIGGGTNDTGITLSNDTEVQTIDAVSNLSNFNIGTGATTGNILIGKTGGTTTVQSDNFYSDTLDTITNSDTLSIGRVNAAKVSIGNTTPLWIYPTDIELEGTSDTVIKVAGSNLGVQLLGNKNAGDTGTDVVLGSAVSSRSAGYLLEIKNGTSSLVQVTPIGGIAINDIVTTTTKTWHYHSVPTEWILDTNSSISTGALPIYVTSGSASGKYINGAIRLPAGATITGVDILANNPSGSTSRSPTLVLQKLSYLAGGTPGVTTIVNNSQTWAASSGTIWKSFTVTPTQISDDDYIAFQLDTGGNGDIFDIYEIRITYTTTYIGLATI